jgi:hypothetical protein
VGAAGTQCLRGNPRSSIDVTALHSHSDGTMALDCRQLDSERQQCRGPEGKPGLAHQSSRAHKVYEEVQCEEDCHQPVTSDRVTAVWLARAAPTQGLG